MAKVPSKKWKSVIVLVGTLMLGLMSSLWGTAQTSREVPRTAWGTPDFGGVWDYRSVTPLERPEQFADKAVLTEEEAATVERERAAWVERIDAGENGSVPGNDIHTRVFLDFGTRTVADRRSSLIIDPPNGRKPPMTPEGETRGVNAGSFGSHALESLEDFNFSDRCMAALGVPLIPLAYNSYVQLFQTESHLVMLVEMMHVTRFIPIGGLPHGTVRQRRGDSRGHWEGDTLVVETTNFEYPVAGASRAATLIERFRRVDPEILAYEFTMHDPATWTATWTARQTLRNHAQPIFEYACHEGNYGLTNMLQIAREAEATGRGRR